MEDTLSSIARSLIILRPSGGWGAVNAGTPGYT